MDMNDRFSGINAVINEPLKFKVALEIGEDAYASLRCGNKIKEWWDLIGAAGSGAAVAKSGIVATTFFAPQGLLATLGFGAAVTPLGWVVAAALVSGGAWYGIQKMLDGAADDRITKIPKFINTPIDVLAVGLFDLLAPLALKVAAVDGNVSDEERAAILRHFVRIWGFNEQFVCAGLLHLEHHLDDVSIEDTARRLAAFKKSSPDCNFEAMSQSTLDFLRQIMEADGEIDEAEELAIASVQAIFADAGRSAFSKHIQSLGGTVSQAVKQSADSVSVGLSATEERARMLARKAAESEVFNRVAASADKASEALRTGASSVREAARSVSASSTHALKRLAGRFGGSK